jgi:glucosamine kinase
MTLYLGIDGGGTGCRAALADASGRVVGRGEAASANIWTDPEGALTNILSAARAALDAAGAADRIGRVHAVLGLAGANVPSAAARLADRLPFARLRIESDAVITLKGALGDDDGITAALGTGSVYGVQRSGAIRMIGGWGYQLGDQGSGAWMGRALLVAALLAHDGLADPSPLLTDVLAERDGPTGVVAFGQTASPGDMGRYAPRIFAAAAAGDPAAIAVVAAAEADVVRSIDRLMADGPLPVCFMGGLGQVFAERLAGRYAGQLRAPKGTGLDGALDLARRLA